MTAILPVSNNETPALSDASWRAVGTLSALLDDSEVITPVHIRTAMRVAFGADEAGGAWDWRLGFDCVEAAVWLFLRRWWGAMETRATSPDAMLAMLERVAGLMPTQSRRSEEQNALQQFSTPLPLAWLARLAADIRAGDVVLEPSAGTGALAIHAELAGAQLVLNEIGEARRGILGKLFPDAPLSNHHAAYIQGLMAHEPLVDVVLMNPPFSADPAKLGHRSSNETLRHFRAAFQRLKPSGRCVIITGANTPAASLVEGLDDAHMVFSAVMEGAVFAKHGTRFPTAIHVIDKMPPQIDGAIIKGKSLAEIAALLEALPPREKPQAPLATLGLFDEDAPSPTVSVEAVPLAYEPNATPLSAIHSEGIFQPWQAGAVHIPAAKPHPSILAEAVAMAAIRPPLPSYRPHLPARLIDEGVLSNAQLETIIHAGEAHQRIMPQRFTFDEHAGEEIIIPSTKEGEGFQLRQGYFLGDGTGAGKGRQAAGIVLDNWLQGRTKAVWFSKSDKLIEDARRDWRDVGGKDSDIVSLSKFRQGAPITMQSGILFATYATLRSGERNGKASRLQQICEWLGSDFDGVILFDEAHALAGAGGGEKSERGSRAPSKQGVAGLALQNLVPLARVVYVSATGASSVNALAYALRLGLWSQPSIPFATRKDFVSAMDAGGVAAAEIVARDLKVLGLYNARSLSYEGVEVDILASPLNDDQKGIYDEWAGAFHIIHNNLEAALESTGIVDLEGTTRNKNAKAAARSAFESTKQRFFSHLLTAMKCPMLIKAIDGDIAAGHAVIIQIVSTGEAVMQRCLDRIPPSEWQDLSIDVTPREYVLDYLNNAFPTQMQVEYKDEDDNIKSKPLFDAEGNIVTDPRAEAMRAELIERLASLPPMPSALDQLIWHYGTDTIAEITGRSRRIVRHSDGRMAVERRPASAGLTEAAVFMADEKRILIFSDAGGTGRSYHADANAKNNRRRVHYLLEAGWRADAAIQGLGRSNRTGQATPPIFRPVSTDVKGEKRFISTIARRLDTLGAITRGQRASASQGLFREEDNLESDYARAALRHFYGDLYRGRIDGHSIGEFEAMTGLTLTYEGALIEKLPPMHTFLNRLLALPIDTQNALFEELEGRIASRIELAKQNGTYELGVETITADRLAIISTEDITGEHNLQLHEIKSEKRIVPYTMQELDGLATQAGGHARWMQNAKSKHIALVTPTSSLFTEDGAITPRVMLRRPNRIERIPVKEFTHSHWQDIRVQSFAPLWQAECAALPEFEAKSLHLVTGTLLPVWDKLPTEAPRIRRLTTDDGTVLLGRLLDDAQLRVFRTNFGLETPQPCPYALFDALLDGGEAVSLAQGFRLRSRLVHQNYRIELSGEVHEVKDWLKAHGCLVEIANYKMEIYVPNAEVLGLVIGRWPVV